jgi:hypothetical protein
VPTEPRRTWARRRRHRPLTSRPFHAHSDGCPAVASRQGRQSEPSSEISNECDVPNERERVVLRRADHGPVLGPTDKGVAGDGSGRHRLRTALHECAAATECAVGSG